MSKIMKVRLVDSQYQTYRKLMIYTLRYLRVVDILDESRAVFLKDSNYLKLRIDL
jgi:hypothetical protein